MRLGLTVFLCWSSTLLLEFKLHNAADLGTMTQVGTIDDKRILLTSQTLNFDQAFRSCRQIGGWLITVETVDQQNFIGAYLINNGSPSIWIGSWRVGTGGTTAEYYYWLRTGVSLTDGYSNWSTSPVQPDNAEGDQACVAINEGYGFSWDDVNCDVLLSAACEVDVTVPVCANGTTTVICN